MTPKELVEWLDAQEETVHRSYRESDGIVRDPHALSDLRAIEDMKRLIERHDARTSALSQCRTFIHMIHQTRIGRCPGRDTCEDARVIDLADKALSNP